MCFIILYERAYNRHFILVLFTVPNMGSKNIFGAHCGLNMFADVYLSSVPPEVTEEPVVVLPTNAPYEVKFAKTTTYYWPNFDLNATENADKGRVTARVFHNFILISTYPLYLIITL